MRQLVKRARAVIMIVNGKVVGYRMTDGSVACVKVRYPDDVRAQIDLARIRAVTNHGYVPVRAYRCEHCSGWHLTSRRA